MAERKWSDLAPRMISGVVMVLGGLALIWAGGHWFRIFIALACGGMVWEMARMCAPLRRDVPLQMGGVAAVSLALALYLPGGFALPFLLAPSMVGLSLLPQRRTLFITFCAMILIAGYGMVGLRDGQGALWLGWLVAVVVVTDVAGYFAGRLIGGPKFWPRVSPKKTWSGTVAGWIAAALVGLAFGMWTGEGLHLAGVSVALSMASQMGDIAESAAKRRVGVKDSSNLIPGHGGLMDRFDGMLGASLMLLLTGPWTGLFFIAG
ncbi:phosphatidate cytidylyltransferase [Pseudooceanicola sp. 200-1SW]|uniref:phosphatidate cytidylyltransferase n=1 Tax=Pseudooceanicola sp. 200-1SW TaxID=3425949 RepID=UPI003D7F668C